MFDAIKDLRFARNYHRQKQLERLNAHVESGKSINSFTGNSAEYSVDSLLDYIDQVLKAERELRENARKPFWKKFKK